MPEEQMREEEVLEQLVAALEGALLHQQGLEGSLRFVQAAAQLAMRVQHFPPPDEVEALVLRPKVILEECPAEVLPLLFATLGLMLRNMQCRRFLSCVPPSWKWRIVCSHLAAHSRAYKLREFFTSGMWYDTDRCAEALTASDNALVKLAHVRLCVASRDWDGAAMHLTFLEAADFRELATAEVYFHYAWSLVHVMSTAADIDAGACRATLSRVTEVSPETLDEDGQKVRRACLLLLKAVLNDSKATRSGSQQKRKKHRDRRSGDCAESLTLNAVTVDPPVPPVGLHVDINAVLAHHREQVRKFRTTIRRLERLQPQNRTTSVLTRKGRTEGKPKTQQSTPVPTVPHKRKELSEYYAADVARLETQGTVVESKVTKIKKKQRHKQKKTRTPPATPPKTPKKRVRPVVNGSAASSLPALAATVDAQTAQVETADARIAGVQVAVQLVNEKLKEAPAAQTASPEDAPTRLTLLERRMERLEGNVAEILSLLRQR
ncbi:MAG: hypothetical protein MHM6MM_003383 [Cercozoa sp. M6MM]